MEERVFTDAPVSNLQEFFSKVPFIDESLFQPDMRKHATYVPGFKLADMVGGNLSVVGFLKPTTSEEQVEEFDLSQFSSTFYTKILNKAINSMPISTRTRTNNLIHRDNLTVSPSFIGYIWKISGPYPTKSNICHWLWMPPTRTPTTLHFTCSVSKSYKLFL